MKILRALLLAGCVATAAQAAPTNPAAVNEFKSQLTLANKGDVEAQYRVGEMYEKGLGTDQDVSLAIIWYGRASLQGDKRAAEQAERARSQHGGRGQGKRAIACRFRDEGVAPAGIRRGRAHPRQPRKGGRRQGRRGQGGGRDTCPPAGPGPSSGCDGPRPREGRGRSGGGQDTERCCQSRVGTNGETCAGTNDNNRQTGVGNNRQTG